MDRSVMSEAQQWDWATAARRAGVDRYGRYNAGTIGLPQTALIWRRSDGDTSVLSGTQMTRLVSDTSAALRHLGVKRGDRIAGLMGRRPESFTLPLAAWRLGAIYVPLFSGFGGEALRVRLEDSGPSLIVTDTVNRTALSSVQESVADAAVLVVDGNGEPTDNSLPKLLAAPRSVPEAVATDLHETAVIMYTSGTTGRPKGCEIPHRATLSLLPYIRHCLDIGPEDVLFSGADTGWSFGLFTTGLAPMAAGATRIMYEPPFEPAGWWACVRDFGVTHLAAAPTAFRQLAIAGADLLPNRTPAMTSAGEPLDAPTFSWFQGRSGEPVYDSYGLTELGMLIANTRDGAAGPPQAGSMGRPLPGFDVRLLQTDGDPTPHADSGRIAVRDNGFFLSSGYWGRQAEWDARFIDGWFITEDIAREADDGTLHYVGRQDDVIVTSGYNVGPGEVESALISHPLILDAACIAEHDQRKGQTITAYVVLADDAQIRDELVDELRAWVGGRIGWHAAPRRFEARPTLPRTDSGKVQRQLLRGQQGTQDTVRPSRGKHGR